MTIASLNPRSTSPWSATTLFFDNPQHTSLFQSSLHVTVERDFTRVVHQEDFSQATGKLPEKKYEEDAVVESQLARLRVSLNAADSAAPRRAEQSRGPLPLSRAARSP